MILYLLQVGFNNSYTVQDHTLAGYLVHNNAVFYSIIITPSAADIPTAGDETYSLSCSVSGTADPATYQWFKGPADNGTSDQNQGFWSLIPPLVNFSSPHCQHLMLDSTLVKPQWEVWW